MFLEHFELTEQPFGVTPDPRFLFLGPQHREALATLLYGTEASRGFIALIARPGMGKTSLLFQFLQSVQNKARTVFLFQTDCHRHELLRQILTDLGLDGTGKDLPTMRGMLNRMLLEEMRAGRRFVLVIDEAQNLEEKVLESVRLLSNFETPWTKLMQIVIAGQPQLAERLARPSLAQLRQRISMVVRLKPFTREETAEYISHRLSIAGYQGPNPFTVNARLMIAEHSEGIPRNINNICFNAMSLACALKKKTIDREIVNEVLTDLDLGSDGGPVSSPKNEENPEYRVLTAPREVKRTLFGRKAIGVLVASVLVFALSWSVGERNNSRSRDVPVSSHLDASSVVLRTTPISPDSTKPTGGDPTRPEEKSPGQETVALTGQDQTQPDTPAGSLAGTRTITILSGQTLYRAVVENLGSYDDDILQEVRKLNPWMTDPHDIAAGQVVVLPLSRKLSAGKLPVVTQALESKAADLEKQ